MVTSYMIPAHSHNIYFIILFCKNGTYCISSEQQNYVQICFKQLKINNGFKFKIVKFIF